MARQVRRVDQQPAADAIQVALPLQPARHRQGDQGRHAAVRRPDLRPRRVVQAVGARDAARVLRPAGDARGQVVAVGPREGDGAPALLAGHGAHLRSHQDAPGGQERRDRRGGAPEAHVRRLPWGHNYIRP